MMGGWELCPPSSGMVLGAVAPAPPNGIVSFPPGIKDSFKTKRKAIVFDRIDDLRQEPELSVSGWTIAPSTHMKTLENQ